MLSKWPLRKAYVEDGACAPGFGSGREAAELSMFMKRVRTTFFFKYISHVNVFYQPCKMYYISSKDAVFFLQMLK